MARFIMLPMAWGVLVPVAVAAAANGIPWLAGISAGLAVLCVGFAPKRRM